MAIEDVLREVGFITFDFAPSPAAASEAVALRCLDLITWDVELSLGCGITTVLKICEKVAIPVIFVTGDVADVRQRLPGSYTLSKPFSSEQLAAAVSEALKYTDDPVRPLAASSGQTAFGHFPPSGWINEGERFEFALRLAHQRNTF